MCIFVENHLRANPKMESILIPLLKDISAYVAMSHQHNVMKLGQNGKNVSLSGLTVAERFRTMGLKKP
jgi:hypothetical protein